MSNLKRSEKLWSWHPIGRWIGNIMGVEACSAVRLSRWPRNDANQRRGLLRTLDLSGSNSLVLCRKIGRCFANRGKSLSVV